MIADALFLAERPNGLAAGLLLGDQVAPILVLLVGHPPKMPHLRPAAEGWIIGRLRSINDTPVVGNWTVGSQDKVGTFNPSQGVWLLDFNGNFTYDGISVVRLFAWGSAGDTPV